MSKIVKQIPPACSLINGIRSIGYNFSTSVADIIDNSITAKATEINIFSDPLNENPYFCILDNGVGMSKKELNNAMIFGSDRSDKINDQLDLGRFGLGLKSASLSQCRELVVVSKKHDEINCMSYNLDNIEIENEWNMIIFDAEEINYLPKIKLLQEYDTGTLVIWRKFDKIENFAKEFSDSFRTIVADAKKHVELVFHRFYDRVKIYFNNNLIDRRDPFLLDSFPRTQSGRQTNINMADENIFITPYVLPFTNTLTIEEKNLLGNPKSIYDDQGFYIYRNKRLIIWGSWLRMNIRSELSKLARIKVDIPSTLDSQWSLDVKKSTAKIPDKIKEQIRASIEDSVIRSKKATRYPGIKEQTINNKIWNRIDMRDGFIKYEINRKDPILIKLYEQLDNNDKVLLDIFITHLENYLPKYSIQTDSIDSLTIINNDELEESKLVEEVEKFIYLFPICERSDKLNSILSTEAYLRIADKYDEILEATNNIRNI